MSDINQGDGQQPDPSQNIKAEFERKLSNLQSSVQAQLQQSHQALAQLIQTQASTQQNAQSYDADDSAYDLYDADGQKKFLSQIQNTIASTVDQRIKTYEDKTVKEGALYAEFPELTDQNNPFTQEVVSMYNTLTPEQRQDPNQLQTIVYQVAAREGLKPKRFRDTTQSESFTLGAGNGENNVAPKKKQDSEHEGIENGSMLWLEVLNHAGAPVDPKNPKDLEQLREFSKRTGWTKRHTSPEFSRKGNR